MTTPTDQQCPECRCMGFAAVRVHDADCPARTGRNAEASEPDVERWTVTLREDIVEVTRASAYDALARAHAIQRDHLALVTAECAAKDARVAELERAYDLLAIQRNAEYAEVLAMRGDNTRLREALRRAKREIHAGYILTAMTYIDDALAPSPAPEVPRG
jgi:hypothetical protein